MNTGPTSDSQAKNSSLRNGSASNGGKSGKALLLSAYDGVSHRLWRDNLLTMFPDMQWTVLVLPPRYFAWRIRGNSLSWAFNHREQLTDNYDFLLATSMVDLSTLRGFVPQLGLLPTAVYFHENQFVYPQGEQQFASVEPQILNLYTALCADRIIFNSHWNRQSFLDGVTALLRKLPDHVPPGIQRQLENSDILPVPLSDEIFSLPRGTQSEQGVLSIVWNHRWEHDKGPALLLAIMQELIGSNVGFRLHLLGEQFRKAPTEFALLQEMLSQYYQRENIAPGHCGYLSEREDYLQLLRDSDVVLSTADHDFQGLSLLEGCASGCSPVAPNKLVYPEYLVAEFLYDCSANTHAASATAVARLQALAHMKSSGTPLPLATVDQFRQSELLQPYRELFQSLRRK